ncbi:MAG: LysM peptidoglycan-binding domain-containing protein [Anaerolineae bacterium]|nr:LysM peptidoglycan-binding domain-containing protein [Anaerolineae bacterium]
MTTPRQLRVILSIVLVMIVFAPFQVSAQEGPTRYTVQPGENLFRIALKYNVTVSDIAAANGISDVTHIYAGQVLIIPNGDTTSQPNNPPPAESQPAEQQPVAASQPAGEGVYHTVQRGESLKSIAAKYGVTWQQLVDANNLANPNVIYVGQRLFVPGVASAPASHPPAEEAAATGSRRHVVQAGEGLSQIAAKYGVTWTAIAAANNLANPDLIYAGMVLIIPDKGTESYSPSYAAPNAPDASGKVILVILSQQRTYAYEDGRLLRAVTVSTGLPGTPTVTGEYRIYVKYDAQLMTGPGYYLPNVPYVMYFYRGYGLHGTYWHNNFGHPMSHGCVNLPTDEARWFYNWAPVGTKVVVRW